MISITLLKVKTPQKQTPLKYLFRWAGILRFINNIYDSKRLFVSFLIKIKYEKL